jgi:hypothetical protein
MRARAPFLVTTLSAGLLWACNSEPVGTTPDGRTRDGGSAPGISASVAASGKSAISGTIAFVGAGTPGRVVVTSSGKCHVWDVDAYDQFSGDVSGPVTFHENEHYDCDFSHLTGSGPFDAEVTWNGRTGTIAGQWETNCVADPSQPIGLSCDGTMNARGSGGLDGVQFHFKWGPGWYPFKYTGTAIAH